MRDGIDGRAFRRELQTLSPKERSARKRKFGKWLRAASEHSFPHSYIAFSLTIFGIFAAVARIIGISDSRELLAAGILAIAVAQLFSFKAISGARNWRERHHSINGAASANHSRR